MLNHEVVRCPLSNLTARRSQEGVQLPKGVEEEQSRDLACGIWMYLGQATEFGYSE